MVQPPSASFARHIASLTGLGELLRIRDDGRGFNDPFAFAQYALDQLCIDLPGNAAQVSHVPARGPLVVVANHAFGGLDGLAAILTIGKARRDLRVLANPFLMQLEPLRPLLLPLDPFGKPASRHANAVALRAALRWLTDGGALLIFPAGEVSHLDLRAQAVIDPKWHTTAARLVRRAQAQVAPMYFDGHNSALFNVAGLLHPALRTMLLPHELARRAGASVELRVGRALSWQSLQGFATDATLTAYLRRSTYLLKDEVTPPLAAVRPPAREPASLAAPVDSALMAAEIAALPPQALMLSAGGQQVYCARARQLPATMRELGRLRELTFRAVGEGTGNAVDIDAFDEYYEQLFIWNATRREIVGGYRIGRVDEIVKRHGLRGLYTSSLFEFREPFRLLLGSALELGRSFVRPECQKSFAALLLLWKGIGEFVGRHPGYVRLMGPVSISNSYRPVSRELLVRYLHSRNFDHVASALVRARTPWRQHGTLRRLSLDLRSLGDLDALSGTLADLEADGKGVPVLLRHYLKLGGRLLGFNVDGDFGDAIDCLLLVDLRQADPRVLRKYFPAETLKLLARAHRMKGRSRAAA